VGVATKAYIRPRAYVRVQGPDAADLLQRLASNDVLAAESCEALLLTAKGRVIAPLLVWRRGEDDFLLLTEPELGEALRGQLVRMRLRARCEIEPEEHSSTLVFGGEGGVPNDEYGEPAVELLDANVTPTVDDDELEVRRIEAGRPRWGRELDDSILPAEAGLTDTHVSFTKGCYPGQEPIARLHYRGHANRALRILELDGLPEPNEEIREGERAVGRVTSAARRPDGSVVALGYLRTDLPEGAELALASGAPVRGYTDPPPRP
jgi:folate-binding protein YgfZ